jgi:peptidyl-prolyl cis-trans isomerase A (cyclophilin A)
MRPARPFATALLRIVVAGQPSSHHMPLLDASSTRRAMLLCAALAFGARSHAADAPQVLFKTSAGNFTVEVYPDKAPKTVANFLQYVRDKHYDGTIFHRVIPTFMVQGGGFDTKYKERPTRAPVEHEGRQALAKGGDRNVVGTVAMARTSDPNSATSQFFINVADNGPLDPVLIPDGDPVRRFEYQGRVFENVPRERLMGAQQLTGYTVFGKVVSGMDVIQKIKAVPTGAAGPFPTDAPTAQILIQSATQVK